jgi:guanine deaminase
VSAQPELLRATILHTPRNPFQTENALDSYTDGGLAIADGVIRAVGDYTTLRDKHPDAVVHDWRGSVILPGFIDTHIHFPQTRIIGGFGHPLLDWLRLHALPEELRMGEAPYARAVAAEFVRALVRNGTTTALVFGAHFSAATEYLFEAACAAGIRITSGLVLSDRLLPEPLRQTPEQAYRASQDLIARYHGKGDLRYAVTPRFALSASEGMLEVCEALLREQPGLLFQTHLNENCREIADVHAAFAWAKNYLAVSGSAVAHCPSSNAMLGSGIFPMRRHLAAGVRFALGSDVGAGTGFGMLKEALQSYMMQSILPNGVPLSPAQLLYLATGAGAAVLGLAAETGDFTPGKSADLVRIQPAEGTPLAAGVERAESAEGLLAALIAQASAENIHEVRVRGEVLAL